MQKEEISLYIKYLTDDELRKTLPKIYMNISASFKFMYVGTIKRTLLYQFILVNETDIIMCENDFT